MKTSDLIRVADGPVWARAALVLSFAVTLAAVFGLFGR